MRHGVLRSRVGFVHGIRPLGEQPVLRWSDTFYEWQTDSCKFDTGDTLTPARGGC
jgi:hypothetical protein